jgi:hypothetical protein
MGYLKALQLMVRAYKAAKGVMPKGLDLLKLKMRARQKAIDSKKIIQFPKDRITDPFKPRPQGIEKLIKKGDVKIGQAPKTTKVKEPVDPKLIMQESEKQTLARMRKENKEAIKKFKEKMDKPRDGKAIGGYVTRNVTPQPRDPKLQNLLDVYESNPTLQSQMTADEYLMQTYRPSPSEPQTYAEMTQQQPTAGIPAIKPIVPIIPPQGDGDDGGGGITAPTGYGYRGPSITIDDIEEGTITPEEERFATGQALRGLAEKTMLGNLFFKAKDYTADRAKEIADKVRAEEIARAEALRSLQESIARNQARASQQDWSGASDDYSGGFDPSTGNYDDPYSPGDTE